MVLWLLGVSSVVAAAAAPTPVPCVTTTRPASKSERYLIFASGHVRSLSATAETLHRRIVMPTRPAAVDVVYSVWSDAGYGCEERILRDVQTRFNFTVYTDPRQCDHARNTNFHGGSNQWDAIRRALGAALATHGDVEYGLVLKARTDLSFSKDVDLKEYQRRFAAEPAVQKANGHWLMVSACPPVWKSKFYGAFVLNRRVDLHAIDATSARWRGDAGPSPIDGARTAALSPRNDLVKDHRCTRRTG